MKSKDSYTPQEVAKICLSYGRLITDTSTRFSNWQDIRTVVEGLTENIPDNVGDILGIESIIDRRTTERYRERSRPIRYE